ncbi:MAG: type I-C CRISPR-associated protein Cas8c/Csd1 [bacterium]|nr:type I-C CRISPR-associated protein Cas8c/Csd1 [bacterium]
MAWLRTLAETYDVNAGLAGRDKNGQAVLLPISHSTFQAQIEVTIDLNGNYQDAKKLEKGSDAVTIIPVTEDSAARSSGIAPHPLCDKLCYAAGDYTAYTGDDKEAYFDAYIEQLRDWAEAEDTHPMVQAVYQYLKKKTLIQDLVTSKVLELNEDGRLTDHTKLQGQGQTGANVRFVVLGSELPQEVWKNQTLYQKYIRHYQQRSGEKALCYASGRMEVCSDKHPSKIRSSGDKSKLISGNDETGFTYRGRFVSKEQAVSVGYDASQKAHNAIRWLIQKQGYTRDDMAIVAWIVNRDMPVPDMMKDSVNAYGGMDDFDFDFDTIGTDTLNDVDRYDTGKLFAEQFRRAVNGYIGKFHPEDRAAVIALEAATTGRLSVVYYDEMGGKQYVDAIRHWQEHCCWRRAIKVGTSEEERRWITCECTPSPRDMALAAFGVQRSEWLEAESKLIRSAVKRILPCITGKEARIPEDMIKAAARRASMPQSMSDFVWYNDVLCVVCAMIRYNEYEKEGTLMDDFLNDNLEDRDVLFGRLLAICDYMEQRAMFEYDENGKPKDRRMTNAKRYWNAYSSRPAKTFQTIRQNLNAYERKLTDYEHNKFEEWIGKIMAQLGNGFHNAALSERYLPGYYLQMEWMKNAFQKKEQ